MLTIGLGILIYFVGCICKYLHDDYNECTKNITSGYKLKSALKDEESFNEANNYIYKFSLISLVFAIVFTAFDKIVDFTISNNGYLLVNLSVIFSPIILTEIHLYRFNKNRNLNE